jgi:hypothetical protein
VVYICQVIGLARQRRGRATAAAVVAIVALCGTVGCGSGGDAPARETASTGAAESTRKDSYAQSHSAANAVGAAKARRQGQRGGSGAVSNPTPETAGSRRYKTAFHKAMKECPPGLPGDQCETLVKGAALTKGSHSSVVAKPRDCLEAMSREECEATLTAQDDASQSDSSLDVQECLKTRTEKCKEVLGPMFEEQYAASQEAGE